MIALGMGGFIVMDMVTTGSRASGNEFRLGEVNGEDVDWAAFQRAERILYPNSTGDVYGQRNFLWDYMVEDIILKQEGEEMGLSVGDEEMEELQFGQRLSPIVERNFRDPKTGQIDRQSLDQIKANLGTGNLQPQLEDFWSFQKEEIRKDRLQSKLAGLVKKSIYTPTWMAQQMQAEQGSSIDFEYVAVPFDKVSDEEAAVSDDDYKAWMAENKRLIHRKQEFRAVDFVVFNVVPTAQDSADVREKITSRIEAFRTTDNDSLFVENNYGLIDAAYVKSEELSGAIADTIFDLPVGTVYGPYLDANEYRAVKVLGRKVIPDSVKSRHILIRATTPADLTKGLKTLDSLKTLIEAGAGRFDSLAMRFSQDGSAREGGDLGWSAVGRMVKPFNDVIFYTAEPGELHTVVTQFGVHLVQVTDRKYIENETGVKLAYLVEPVVPSEETQSIVYDKALQFVGQNRTLDEMRAAVEQNPELSIEKAEGLTANAYQFANLGSGGSSRDIVRWAFDEETSIGMVAPEAYVYDEPTLFYNARYVVPALRAVLKTGTATLDEVKEFFGDQVKNKKKGEVLAAKLAGKDINMVASEYGIAIDTFEKVNFNMSYLQGLGNEARLIGKVTQLQNGESAGPIVGLNGVYMVRVISRTEASISTDIASFRRQLSGVSRTSVDSRLLEAMRDAAKVKDNRFNFF
jgi:peptidyl-prolyl cis-trans isomerase D